MTRLANPAEREFSRVVDTASVSPEGMSDTVSATPEECKRVAQRFELPDVAGIDVEYTIEPWKRGGYRVRGTATAGVSRVCVVSLDRFDTTLDVAFDRVLVDGLQQVDDSDDEILVSLEDADEDVLEGQSVDVGELVVEELGLALEPYPRKPGVAFDGYESTSADEDEDGVSRHTASPFAKLSALKRD